MLDLQTILHTNLDPTHLPGWLAVGGEIIAKAAVTEVLKPPVKAALDKIGPLLGHIKAFTTQMFGAAHPVTQQVETVIAQPENAESRERLTQQLRKLSFEEFEALQQQVEQLQQAVKQYNAAGGDVIFNNDAFNNGIQIGMGGYVGRDKTTNTHTGPGDQVLGNKIINLPADEKKSL